MSTQEDQHAHTEEGVMQDYKVCYLEEPGDDMDWTFECQAEDEAHAKEQCEDAYPGCVVLHVSPVDSEVKP